MVDRPDQRVAIGATTAVRMAAPAKFDVVFGSGGARTGILTYGWDEHRPLVYDTVDGLTWTPVDVAASLREFYPNAATPLGTDWLLGGSGVGASAWLGHDGVWAPVTVPTPPARNQMRSPGSRPSSTVRPA